MTDNRRKSAARSRLTEAAKRIPDGLTTQQVAARAGVSTDSVVTLLPLLGWEGRQWASNQAKTWHRVKP